MQQMELILGAVAVFGVLGGLYYTVWVPLRWLVRLVSRPFRKGQDAA